LNCYIHLPFCAAKCGYCAFYSEAGVKEEVIDVYLDKLSVSIKEETLSTLYIGGGTPTFLSAVQLEKLLALLKKKFIFQPGAEISIEANPETLSEEKVALLRTFFTRISLGVQSFDPVLREKIGRQCSQTALERALELIKAADFPHWNCDLIYSLPDENMAAWEKDLHTAGALGVDHVSCYSLTPERAAILGETFAVDDERERAMYELAGEILGKYGIKRYEISNYAVPGGECRHNLNVWRGGLLRGYGAAAADFDGVDRHIGVESLTEWLKGVPPETDHIPSAERLNEIFAVNLRTVDGWKKDLWAAVPHADDWSERVEIASKTAKKFPGCLQISGGEIKLTAEGLLYWNDIAEDIL
jgi:oxygen-independent coproporphyrinogen-3 oxidase